jgi:hypothetical protein
LVLLCILIYVFGIIFTQITPKDEGSVGAVFFNSVGTSCHSLIVYGTFMDNLGNLVFELWQANWLWTLLFYLFLLLSALTVLNMLIGVLCENVCSMAATERENLAIDFMKESLLGLLQQGDANGDLRINKAEFLRILEMDQAISAMQELDVDVIGMIDLADFIFESSHDLHFDEETGLMLDPEEEKTLSFAEFMELVLQLRGTNTTTVRDNVDVRKLVTFQSLKFRDHLSDLERRFRAGRAATTLSGNSRTPKDFHDGGNVSPKKMSVAEPAAIIQLSTPVLHLDQVSSQPSDAVPPCELHARTVWLEQVLQRAQGDLQRFLELLGAPRTAPSFALTQAEEPGNAMLQFLSHGADLQDAFMPPAEGAASDRSPLPEAPCARPPSRTTIFSTPMPSLNRSALGTDVLALCDIDSEGMVSASPANLGANAPTLSQAPRSAASVADPHNVWSLHFQNHVDVDQADIVALGRLREAMAAAVSVLQRHQESYAHSPEQLLT